MNTAAVNILIGIALLILGRKLFWFFVGVAGFLVGMNIAARIVTGPDWMKLAIALAAGVIGALLAIFFYKVAIALAGFVIGGYIAADLLHFLAIVPPAPWTWAPYIISGLLGAVLILFLFDWAIILLSSLSGASLIVQGLVMQRTTGTLLFAALVIIGILIQSMLKHHPRAPAP